MKLHGRRDARPDPATDALCGLIRALEIEETLYLELPPDDVRTRLDSITTLFTSTHPEPHLAGIPDLITAVDNAIGDVAVAAYR